MVFELKRKRTRREGIAADRDDLGKCIDLDALFDDIKDNIQEGMPPLKPLQLLELLKAIYEGKKELEGEKELERDKNLEEVLN
nr:12864_t:CDS:2 [Entrophospora candida]